MIKVGIRAHDLLSLEKENKKVSIDTLAILSKRSDFDYLQLVLNKALIDSNGLLDEQNACFYKNSLAKQNVKVAMLGAYFNPIHSDSSVVESGINRFKNHLKFASMIGTKYVGSETGSCNNDKWTYNENNLTEESYQKVYKVFEELCEYAQDYNSYVAIEGSYNHVINTPKRLKRLIDDLNTEKVKVIIDLYNYLNIDNHEKRYLLFEEALSLLQNKIVVIHLKDYIIVDEVNSDNQKEKKLKQVGLGKGLMDFSLLIKLIKKYVPNGYLIFEGVVGCDIQESKSYIDNIIKKEVNYEC